MIRYLEGDIFTSPAQTIVNTVNTVGVMGKGIALEYRKRYPSMFKSYKSVCEKKRLAVGKLMLCYEADHWVLLFPTKEHWRNPSKLEYIEKGLLKFLSIYAESGITSVAFPKLGCGNGELSWEEVKPVMTKYLGKLPIDVYIYMGPLSNSIPEHKDQQRTLSWLRQNAKDMSFNGLCDDIRYNCSIVPYSYKADGRNMNVSWKNGLLFLWDDDEQFMSEDDFFECWDEIRKKEIVVKDNDGTKGLIYGLLYSLGYFTEVTISDGKTTKEGYQLNEGLGRLYSLEGTANVQ